MTLPVAPLTPLYSFMGLIATPLGGLYLAMAVLAVCLCWQGLYPLRRWRYRHFPGPFGLPFLGNLPQLISMDTTKFLSYAADKYGPVCKVWFGTRPWLVVSDPDLVRKFACQSTARPLELTTYMDTLTGENRLTEDLSAFIAHGEVWRRGRRAFEASIIHPASLSGHLPAIRNCLGRFVPSLERYAASGQPLNVHKALGDLMLAITGELAYGVDFEVDFSKAEQDAQQPQQLQGGKKQGLGAPLAQACRGVFECLRLENSSLYMLLQLVFPSLGPVIRLLAHYLPDTNQRRSMEARTAVCSISRQLADHWAGAKQGQAAAAATVKAELAEDSLNNGQGVPTKEGNQGGGGDFDGCYGGGKTVGSSGAAPSLFREVGDGISGSSFLAAMLEGRKGANKEERLSELEVIAQSMTFILASYETSSNSTSVALLLLATHPEVQGRLREEVDGLAGRELSPELLAGELPYTEAVLKETMRLYPPVATLHRHAREDIDLGGGRVVPRGTFLALSNYNLHHDPALWPEPERFMPERFLAGGAGVAPPAPTHPAAWTGFGLGARMCVGHKLAMMITKSTLVSLIGRYTFELAPGQEPRPRMATGLTFGPKNGIWLRVSSRD